MTTRGTTVSPEDNFRARQSIVPPPLLCWPCVHVHVVSELTFGKSWASDPSQLDNLALDVAPIEFELLGATGVVGLREGANVLEVSLRDGGEARTLGLGEVRLVFRYKQPAQQPRL